MLKDCGGNKQFHNILVPVAGGPNSSLAVEIALIMAESPQSDITVMTIDRGGKTKFNIEEFVKEQCEKLGVPQGRFRIKTIKAKSAVIGILRQSRKYDLIVMGTSNKPFWAQFTGRSLPEKIACRAKKPTIIVKSSQGMRSWIRKWI
jgi:nucleotide-binding universal stress UspA family protein